MCFLLPQKGGSASPPKHAIEYEWDIEGGIRMKRTREGHKAVNTPGFEDEQL